MNRFHVNWVWGLCFFELLGLAIWIGGLVVIMAAVIPAVFNTMAMEPAGHFLRRVFDGYNAIVIGVVLILLCAGGIRVWSNVWRKSGFVAMSRLEVGLLLMIMVTTILIVGILGPQAVQLQAEAFEAEQGTTRKAAYDAFFRLHMIVRALHMINWGLALALFVVKLKQWMGKPPMVAFR